MSAKPALSCLTLVVALAVAGCAGDVVNGHAVPSGSGSAPGASIASGAVFADPGTAATVLRSARQAVAATSTYDYRDIPGARANGLRYVTGAVRDQYSNVVDTVIARNAPAQRLSQRAKIDNAGLGPVDADGATVLVFGQLNITKGVAGDRKDPFALVAHLQREGSRWLVDRVTTDGSVDGNAPGGPQLGAAAGAARQGARDLVTFTRVSFDADFRRVLDETTGTLRSDVTRQRGNTLKTMTSGGLDLLGVVRACAVEAAAGSTVRVLVSLDGYRVVNGTRTSPTRQSLRVTVVRTSDRWSLGDVTTIGIN